MPTGKYTFDQVDAPQQQGRYSLNDIDGTPQAPEAPKPPTMLQKIGQGVEDFGKGVAKGALSTVGSADRWSREHLPAFMTNSWFGMGAPADLDKLDRLKVTHNDAQSLGKGVEQVGEFFIPGGAEDQVVAKAAPYMGKLAPLARVGVSAVGSGAVNKLQGGGFGEGAAMGAGGTGASMVLKKVAPMLAETALRVRGTDRAYGANPGEALLAETRGFTPAKIARTAQDRLENITNDKTHLAQSALHPVNIQDAQQIAKEASRGAASRNNKNTIKDVDDLVHQLHSEYSTSQPIGPFVSAERAVNLQRGVGDLRDFRPTAASTFADQAAGRAYHSIGDQIEKVVPDIAPLNKRASSLLPVLKRAEAVEREAPLPQRLLQKAAAHTGALTGAKFGYEYGGVPGAVLGFAGPELLLNPTAQMLAARSAGSPVVRNAVSKGVSAGSILLRRGKDSPFGN